MLLFGLHCFLLFLYLLFEGAGVFVSSMAAEHLSSSLEIQHLGRIVNFLLLLLELYLLAEHFNLILLSLLQLEF